MNDNGYSVGIYKNPTVWFGNPHNKYFWSAPAHVFKCRVMAWKLADALSKWCVKDPVEVWKVVSGVRVGLLYTLESYYGVAGSYNRVDYLRKQCVEEGL